jgi:hypothetical protein
VTKISKKKVVKLLWKSIEHWHENYWVKEPEEALIDAEDCALCEIFLDESTSTCNGCPVKESTGQDVCRGSPWRKVSWELYDWKGGDKHDYHGACLEEISFLVDLVMRYGDES